MKFSLFLVLVSTQSFTLRTTNISPMTPTFHKRTTSSSSSSSSSTSSSSTSTSTSSIHMTTPQNIIKKSLQSLLVSVSVFTIRAPSYSPPRTSY